LSTIDGSREAAACIRDGKIHSSSAQFPKEIGKVAAEKAYAHLAGQPVDKDIRIPVKLVTKENAADLEVNRAATILRKAPPGVRGQLPLLAVAGGLLVLFSLWVPNFLTPENLLDIAQQYCVYAILGVRDDAQ